MKEIKDLEQTENSVTKWIISILITKIPVVNIVVLILWGFGNTGISQTKRNWAKAMLFFIAIQFIIGAFALSVFVFKMHLWKNIGL